MKKHPKLKNRKKLAWSLFSEWTRRKWADSNGFITCISCSAKVHWKEANASHWRHGHSVKSFLMPENVSPSCIRCNLYLSGNLGEYTLWLIDKYGKEKLDEIRAAGKTIWKPSRQELEDIIKTYKEKLIALDGDEGGRE